MGLALAIALTADLLWGEPQARWHPIRLIGAVIATGGRTFRTVAPSPRAKRAAGIVVAAGFTIAAYLSAAKVIALAFSSAGWVGILSEAALIWISISVGELVKTAHRVDSLVELGRLSDARELLSSLVGRDTERLDEAMVRRAAIESVAENLVDAGVAPIFYAFLGGAPLAFAYRIINTLDSMFGYKTDEYIDFGWASARLDDLASWLPARLTVLVISGASWASGRSGLRAIRTAVIHGRRHTSPNSGLPMAAVAGALRIRLGGGRTYQGVESSCGFFGDEDGPIGADAVAQAGGLVTSSMLLATVALSVLAFCLEGPMWLIS